MTQAEEQHDWSPDGVELSATGLRAERGPAVRTGCEQQEMVPDEPGGRDRSLQSLKSNVKGLYFILGNEEPLKDEKQGHYMILFASEINHYDYWCAEWISGGYG